MTHFIIIYWVHIIGLSLKEKLAERGVTILQVKVLLVFFNSDLRKD